MTPRSRVGGILAVSAVGGAGTMVVELAAVRLLAPWYGTSQVVWTNVIGVVLLALALGYSLGARLSSRPAPLVKLGAALLLAGVAAALLPVVAPGVANLFLPRGLALQEAADVVLWGSLAASLLLFLPPATVLGCVAPLAVEAVQETQRGAAGRAGGVVLCASTLGSLLGVFGTSHVLVPVLGLRGTFWSASAALVLAGCLALWIGRGFRAPAGVLLIVWCGLLVFGDAPAPSVGEGRRELARAESSYQSVRVVEDVVPARGEADGKRGGMRYLQVNEGFDSFQSVWQPEAGLFPAGFYYNDFALPILTSGGGDPWRLLVLGLGAGTALRVLEGVRPQGREVHAVGVELDPVVVELGARHMGLPLDDPDLEVVAGLDARVALRNARGPFDQVVLDCYANQVEIPPHLCTLEFFREVHAVLGTEGWLSVNLGGFGFDDPVVSAVARTCAEAFGGDVLLLRVPRSRNYSLLARKSPGLSFDELAAAGDPTLRALLAPRHLPGAWRLVGPGDEGLVLTDDRCPIELLQRRSILEGAARLERGEAG